MTFLYKGGESSIYDYKDDIMKINYSPKDYKELHQGIINPVEIFFLKLLDHPNIVKIKHVARNKNVQGMEDNILYITKRYPYTLTEFIKQYKIPNHTAKFIMIECLKALSYLHHNNIIHGDIKPSNILVDPKTKQVVLIDFGHAQFDEKPLHKVVGTEFYQAPEINLGNYDKLIDIFSLGKVFFEICNDEEFEDLIGHMIVKDPSLRWNVQECLHHLDVKYYPKTIKFNFNLVDVDFKTLPKVLKYASCLHRRTNANIKICYYLMLKVVMLGQYNPAPFELGSNVLEKELAILHKI